MTCYRLHRVDQTLTLEIRQQVQMSEDPPHFSAAAHFISLSSSCPFFFFFLVISACDTPVETNQILHNEAVRWC